MSGKTRRQQLEEMLKDEPNDPELRYFLGMDHVSAGEQEEAVRCFRELFALAPDYVPAYLQAGQALVRLGRTGEAREVFRHGIAAAQRQNDRHARDEMQGMLADLGD